MTASRLNGRIIDNSVSYPFTAAPTATKMDVQRNVTSARALSTVREFAILVTGQSMNKFATF